MQDAAQIKAARAAKGAEKLKPPCPKGETKWQEQTFDAVVATPREGKFNKNAARRVRVAGKIPAVVYGAGQDAVAVTVDPKIITKILHSESGHNTIFDLNVEGRRTSPRR